MILYLIFSVVLVAILLIFKLQLKEERHPKLPPTVPWALPLLGHMLSVGDFPCRKFLEWKKKYGPVFFVQFGSFRALVFNDTKLLKEAWKINELNDRVPLKHLVRGAQNKGFLYCDLHDSEQQQFLHKSLRYFTYANSSLESCTNDEVTKLIETIAAKPYNYQIHDSFVYSTIIPLWATIMGNKFQHDDQELLKLAKYVQRITAIPGTVEYLGMFMPWLSNLFPGLTGVNDWVEAYSNLVNFMTCQLKERENSRVRGMPRDVADAYRDKTDETVDPESTFFPSKNFFPQTMAELFIAVGDTVSTALEWTVLLLTKHQNIQRKLQEEISQVITKSRHPCLSDRKNMPYTGAVITEVLRFSSFVPFSLPHFTYKDCQLGDIFIPKNTMLFQNTYGIQYDPEHWENPEEFIPERFLDHNGNYHCNDNFVIFGTGKRLCIGKDIARDELFIFVTRILQRFNIGFGEEIPDVKLRYAVIMRPDPFSGFY